MGSSLEDLTLGLEARQVQAAVTLFVGQCREEASSQFGGGVRPPQKCPGKEFHRHQLMVSKAGEAFGPRRRVNEVPGAWKPFRSAAHFERRFTGRLIDQDRCRRLVNQRPPLRASRRRQLAGEIAADEQAKAEFLECPGGRHAAESRSRALLGPLEQPVALRRPRV